MTEDKSNMLNRSELQARSMSVEKLHVAADARRYVAEDELSVGVACAVADSVGVDEMTLPPLGEEVETDALDALPRSNGYAEMTFSYMDCTVTAGSDKAITVVPPSAN
jgi:hypothetical protein